MKRSILIGILFLVPLIALYGCSGSPTGFSADTGTGGNGGLSADTGADGGLASKTGTLVISAKFPHNGEKGEVGKALIDANTAAISVYVIDNAGNHYQATLTPDEPTGRIPDIAVGEVSIYISTYDSAENMLDYMDIAGEIVEGDNILTATLIRGSWQFVDGGGNPTTITLNKTLASDTTTLSSFSVIPVGGPGGSIGYVSIQGCVYDDPATPDPVPGATVSTSLDSTTAVTDSAGCFFLQTNTPANYCCTPYTITITASGYPTFSQSWVWGDNPTNQVFYMTGEFGLQSQSVLKSSIDPDKPSGESLYGLLWKGSGFDSNLCGATETCWDDGLSYFNQFIGPSTNNNALDSYLPLPPSGGYTPTPDNPTDRSAFIAGYKTAEGITNSSDPEVFNYFNSRVTGSDTMEGTIIEMLTKSEVGTESCYDMSGGPIDCPVTGQALKSSRKGLITAIAKAMSQSVGKSSIGQDGCFRDLQVSGVNENEDCADLNGDGNWCSYPDDYFRVVIDWTWSGDACGHPFKAVGSQLPSTDLQFVIQ